MSMSWRLASRLSVVTLALLVVLVVALYSTRNLSGGANSALPTTQNPSGLQGTDLGGTPAPDFRLTDQFGKSISLSQFRGKPVVLTFLYTHCPDLCPLTAEKLHTVVESLGTDAQRVAILAVSTDPKGDTTASAQSFSQAHHMLNSWHFLLGTHDELTPIWAAYAEYAQASSAAAIATQGPITHGLGAYIIDKQGKERIYLNDSFTSAQLTADLKTLLGE
jgi:protein SCO1